MINVALLNKVMDHIEAHPEEHFQEQWAIQGSCGTAYCFAGHAAVMCGWDPVFRRFGDELAASTCTRDGIIVSIEEVAAGELGLVAESSYALFHSANSREHLRELVDRLTSTGSAW